jgi:hypothetical protein
VTVTVTVTSPIKLRAGTVLGAILAQKHGSIILLPAHGVVKRGASEIIHRAEIGMVLRKELDHGNVAMSGCHVHSSSACVYSGESHGKTASQQSQFSQFSKNKPHPIESCGVVQR